MPPESLRGRGAGRALVALATLGALVGIYIVMRPSLSAGAP